MLSLTPRSRLLELSAGAVLAGLLLLAGAWQRPPESRDLGVLVEEARDDLRDGAPGRTLSELRRAVRTQRDHPRLSEARLVLARLLVELQRAPQAVNELELLRVRDAEYFAGSEAPQLLVRARRALKQVDALTDAPRDAAQVFVIPRLRGGPRQLWQALSRAGANVAIVRAFHLEGDRRHEEGTSGAAAGVYFPTPHVPLVEDRLSSDCAAARASGLRCYAWMTTRATPAPGLQKAAHRDVSWDPEQGRLVPGERLDPFDPKVVRVLERTFRDLAATGADGVLFQDDLMMRRDEGFSKEARRAWRQRTGRALVPSRVLAIASGRPAEGPDAEEFARFKRDRLLEIARRLRAAAREVNPRFEVALNLYYETASSPRHGLSWFAQDLEAAAREDFRWLAVMAYHRQIQDEMALDEAGVHGVLNAMAERLARVPGAEGRVLVKLQSIDWSSREPIPVSELQWAARPFQRFALCVAPADDPERSARLLEAIRAVEPAP